MDFDQMMDAWKAQDDRPLYGVNGDLLRLVLQHEQADLRRSLRREQGTIYFVGSAMAIVAGLFLWSFIHYRGPALFTVAAAVGTGAFLLWVGALWLSRKRQAQRERGFGNTLREEIGRNLSLVDYQLSRAGRWGATTLWMAPVMVGSTLIYWFGAAINTDNDLSAWYHAGMILFIVASVVWSTYATSRKTARKLEPRRQRLSELLEALNASE